jgi:signal transduction histidine kinase
VAREALHNVVRHSGAGAAQLCLAAAPDRLTLTIADHGRGFDMAAPTRGHGLQSMRERVALLGGTLTVESAPGKGTAVCAQLALKP